MRDPDDKLTFYYHGNTDVKIYPLLNEFIIFQEHELTDVYDAFKIDIYLLLDKKKSRYIAVDWDNTISADPECFIALIKSLQEIGYTPFICTLRAPDKENIEEIRGVLEETNIAIYLTDGKPKRKFMKQLGVKVHLWIDDFYPGVCGDSCKLLSKNHIE